ncbi:hypothetical protein [Halorientalis salina]|uniref:hypothetical protein n=1 Tax=Halorientalis salina TaxID=2932266 RepID=UPI0010ABC309|nr:hypothetical protein [Halorientalis salina]
MRWRWRPVVFVTLFVVLLGLSLTGSATAQSASAGGTLPTVENGSVDQPSGSAASSTLALGKELQLSPAQPGEITVTLRYDTPSNLAGLRVELPEDTTVAGTQGFTERDGEYVWDKRTSVPTLTYRLSVNRTREASGPFAGSGDYLFVDAGSWALVRKPQVSTGWSQPFDENITLTKSTTVDGSGAVGDELAYLGEYREYQRSAHGQRFRLVVPEHADMAAQPDEVLDSVATASDALRVGDRDSSVFMIAAPTDSVQWGVNGLQTGESDFWARDRSRLDSADNVWIHEYVHTRQDYEPAAETRWFTEASATYYAALFALEADRIDYRTFRNRLALGERAADTDAVLSDTSTWEEVAPYTKGALVAGELDRRTRLANTDNSLQTAFRRVNSHEGTVGQLDFRSAIRSAGGADVTTLWDRYTTTTATPSMWDRNAHARAFETRLPNVSYQFGATTNASVIRVTGPYRTGTVGEQRPVRLATGETLTADVIVSNTGTAAGEYEATARLDGTTIAQQNGTLDANATTRWPVTHTFTDAGTYALSVGDRQIEVVVTPPATPAVERLTADGSDPVAGDTVTLDATVRNDDAVPAAGNLSLSQDGETVDTRRVVLTPGETRTLSFERTVDAAGDTRFELGDRNLTLTVREPSTPAGTDSGGSDGASSGDGPGFGVGSALVGLTLSLVVWRRV